jgi:hypothetical protein
MSKTPNWDTIHQSYYPPKTLKRCFIRALIWVVYVEILVRAAFWTIRPDEVTYDAVAAKDWPWLRKSLHWGSRDWDNQLSLDDGGWYFAQYNKTSISNLRYLVAYGPRDIRRYCLHVFITYVAWLKQGKPKLPF